MTILATKQILNPIDWDSKENPEVKAVLTVGDLGEATGNFKGDYAVYVGPLAASDEWIARHGSKLFADTASEIFPDQIIDASYYRR